jgi:NAD-dependent deacetylase
MDLNFSNEFLERLENADSIVFFTGAGISAESGIATFRGENGIWNKFKPEELANFDAFLRNPDMVWEWYQYRRSIVHSASPNPGHTAIADFENFYKDVTVVTQNIDNLHRRAGSKTIYELHGNIERNYCIDCHTFYNLPDLKIEDKAPKCEKCGGLIRPDVVWFGEFLPEDAFSNSQNAAERCDICFIVGTSAVVYPAAYIPLTAKESGACLVEINVEETEISRLVDISFLGESGKIMPKIIEEVKRIKSD